MTDPEEIIMRLRQRAHQEPSNGQGGGQLLLDAAAALTAAVTQRDAAERMAQRLGADIDGHIARALAEATRLRAERDSLTAALADATREREALKAQTG